MFGTGVRNGIFIDVISLNYCADKMKMKYRSGPYIFGINFYRCDPVIMFGKQMEQEIRNRNILLLLCFLSLYQKISLNGLF